MGPVADGTGNADVSSSVPDTFTQSLQNLPGRKVSFLKPVKLCCFISFFFKTNSWDSDLDNCTYIPANYFELILLLLCTIFSINLYISKPLQIVIN